MLNRRTFLKVAGVAVVGQSVGSTLGRTSGAGSIVSSTNESAAALASSSFHLNIREPGEYRISGLVRLHSQNVEISGISNKQWISWGELGGAQQPLASFTAFESFDAPNTVQEILVQGGKLESVTAVPIDINA